MAPSGPSGYFSISITIAHLLSLRFSLPFAGLLRPSTTSCVLRFFPPLPLWFQFCGDWFLSRLSPPPLSFCFSPFFPLFFFAQFFPPAMPSHSLLSSVAQEDGVARQPVAFGASSSPQNRTAASRVVETEARASHRHQSSAGIRATDEDAAEVEAFVRATVAALLTLHPTLATLEDARHLSAGLRGLSVVCREYFRLVASINDRSSSLISVHCQGSELRWPTLIRHAVFRLLIATESLPASALKCKPGVSARSVLKALDALRVLWRRVDAAPLASSAVWEETAVSTASAIADAEATVSLSPLSRFMRVMTTRRDSDAPAVLTVFFFVAVGAICGLAMALPFMRLDSRDAALTGAAASVAVLAAALALVLAYFGAIRNSDFMISSFSLLVQLDEHLADPARLHQGGQAGSDGAALNGTESDRRHQAGLRSGGGSRRSGDSGPMANMVASGRSKDTDSSGRAASATAAAAVAAELGPQTMVAVSGMAVSGGSGQGSIVGNGNGGGNGGGNCSGGSTAAAAAATAGSVADANRRGLGWPRGPEVYAVQAASLMEQVFVIGVNNENKILSWNAGAEFTTGYLGKECEGKPLHKFATVFGGTQFVPGSRVRVKLNTLASKPVNAMVTVAKLFSPTGKPCGVALIGATIVNQDMGNLMRYLFEVNVAMLRRGMDGIVENLALPDHISAEIGLLRGLTDIIAWERLEAMARGFDFEWEWCSAGSLLGPLGQRFTAVDLGSVVSVAFQTNVVVLRRTFEKLLALRPRLDLSLDCITMGRFAVLRCEVSIVGGQHPFDASEICVISAEARADGTLVALTNEGFTVAVSQPCIAPSATQPGEETSMQESVSERPSLLPSGLSLLNGGAHGGGGDRPGGNAVGAATILGAPLAIVTLLHSIDTQQKLSLVLISMPGVTLTNTKNLDEFAKHLQENPPDAIFTESSSVSRVRLLLTEHDIVADVVVGVSTEVEDALGGDDEASPIEADSSLIMVTLPIGNKAMRRLVDGLSSNAATRRKAMKIHREENNLFQLHQESPITKGRMLGSGAAGTVYQVTSDLTGGQMAMKVFDTGDDTHRMTQLCNEIRIMCTLNHPNIVHYFYSRRSPESVALFMELCDCSLGDAILKRRKFDVIAVVRQIVSAVAYLHEMNIIHRDLKPQNILLKGDQIKVCDFGTAYVGNVPMSEMAGTLRFMAPEVYQARGYSFPCDIWSLGCVICELIRAQPPWMKRGNHMMLADLKFVELPVIPFSPARDFVAQCLKIDPKLRSTAKELMDHPFLSADHAGGSHGDVGLLWDSRKNSDAPRQSVVGNSVNSDFTFDE